MERNDQPSEIQRPLPKNTDRGFKDKDQHHDQKRLVPDAHTIFDVGANIGQSVEQYRAVYPDAQIHAFEPDPEAFAELVRATERDPLVTCVNLALSDHPGEASLNSYGQTFMNSFMPFSDRGSSYVPFSTELKATHAVGVTTLDTYCSENGIDHVDILKMDTQGAELKILDGARDALNAGQIDVVFCEHIFVDIYTGQADPFEVMSRLVASGFALFDFYDFYYEKSGQLKWGDALYRHQRVVPNI